MTDALEVRIAHLEGAYEQIDKRLGSVESELAQLRSETVQLCSETAQMRSETTHLRSETVQLRAEMIQFRSELTARMDGQFRWLLSTILTTWVTVLLAIFFRA